MQTVFRADDGTIFEKEIDCEKYESSLEDLTNLTNTILEDFFKEDFNTWLDITKEIAKTRQSSLIRFIKSIGEQDAN